MGAVSAGMFSQLHGMEPGIGKVLAHGVVGGMMSEMQGGSFKSGFLAAGFTQGASQLGLFDNLGDPGTWNGRAANAIGAAIVGGTASVIGGGKFANGAMTGAFSRLFNDMANAPAGTGMAIGKNSEGATYFTVAIDRVRDTGLYPYDAWVTTYDSDGIELSRNGPYPASALPDPMQVGGVAAVDSGDFTVLTGTYNATVSLGLNRYSAANKYWALNVGTVPAASGMRDISGVWLHAGYLYSGTGSAGCITIRHTSYNAFISNLWPDAKGSIYVNHEK